MSIELSEYPLEGIDEGETLSFNHEDCPAGEDTRGRLYITRKEGSKYVGYCHNCGNNGIEKGFFRKEQPTVVAIPKKRELLPPEEVITHECWPEHVNEYFFEKAFWCGSDRIDNYGIGYDAKLNRVYFPIYHSALFFEDGTVSTYDHLGFQLRALGSEKPKYLTALKEKKASTILATPNPKALVIVEDLLSGLTIIEHTKNTAVLVKYGVSPITSKEALRIIHSLTPTKYDTRVYIWLDNDNDHVCSIAKGITKSLSLHTPTKLVEIKKDPKYCTPAEIKEALS